MKNKGAVGSQEPGPGALRAPTRRTWRERYASPPAPAWLAVEQAHVRVKRSNRRRSRGRRGSWYTRIVGRPAAGRYMETACELASGPVRPVRDAARRHLRGTDPATRIRHRTGPGDRGTAVRLAAMGWLAGGRTLATTEIGR